MRVQVNVEVGPRDRSIEMEAHRMGWDPDSHMFYLQDSNNDIVFSCPRDKLLYARVIRG